MARIGLEGNEPRRAGHPHLARFEPDGWGLRTSEREGGEGEAREADEWTPLVGSIVNPLPEGGEAHRR